MNFIRKLAATFSSLARLLTSWLVNGFGDEATGGQLTTERMTIKQDIDHREDPVHLVIMNI